MDLFRSKNYDIEGIQKVLKIKDKLRGGFRQKNPDFHLSYWTHDKMLKLSVGIFKHYLPRARGDSGVKPFQNTYVFDTTEPQNSLYGEFIK